MEQRKKADAASREEELTRERIREDRRAVFVEALATALRMLEDEDADDSVIALADELANHVRIVSVGHAPSIRAPEAGSPEFCQAVSRAIDLRLSNPSIADDEVHVLFHAAFPYPCDFIRRLQEEARAVLT